MVFLLFHFMTLRIKHYLVPLLGGIVTLGAYGISSIPLERKDVSPSPLESRILAPSPQSSVPDPFSLLGYGCLGIALTRYFRKNGKA